MGEVDFLLRVQLSSADSIREARTAQPHPLPHKRSHRHPHPRPRPHPHHRLHLALTSTTSNQARASVEAAIAFDAELDTISASRNIIKGRLFQSLLEALRAQGAGHAQMENSVKHLGGSASEFGLNLVQWSMLTLQADALRNLVRIKVADDNDLRTARAGLLLCAEFFRALSALSALRQVDDEYAVLRAISDGCAA